MSEEVKVKLELDLIRCEVLQSIIGLAVEHGDSLQTRAAAEFGNWFANACIAQSPGLREAADEVIERAIEQGVPEEVVEGLREALEPDAITEDEVDKVKIEDLSDRLLREAAEDEDEEGDG